MGAPRFVMEDFWPSDLFLGGIPGAWYDPTDLSTMFQDSAGTTPVTAVEQPVGLILDKSQGLALGAELVTSYYAGGAYGNWNTLTLSGTTLTSVGGTLNGYTARFNVTAGKTYRVQFPAVLVPSAGTWDIVVSWSANGTTYSGSVTGVSINTTSFVFVPPATAVSAEVTIRRTAASGVGATDTIGPFTGFSVRELAGNHASQSTAASRPTYRARYNLLTFSEQFDNAAWSKANASATPDATTAPDGTTTADKLVENAASAVHAFFQNATIVAGSVYTASVYIKAAGRNFAQLRYENSGSSTMFAVSVNLTTGATSTVSFGSPTNTSFSVVAVGSGWWRVTIAATATNTLWSVQIYAQDTLGNNSYLGNGTDGIFIWGAQLLTAADVTATGNAYQRIAAATVYDTAPIFRPYLAFDGMDDGLSTAAITPGTDKCQVFSGLANIAGTNFAIVAEMSANAGLNNGSALLYSPDNVLANFYGFLSRGTVNVVVATNNSAFRPPAINVVSGLGDISGDVATLRVNGAQIVTSGSDQGTGNYLSYPLYIGRRGGVSAPFNGRVYSLILRFGTNLSVSEIAETELWINARCGAY